MAEPSTEARKTLVDLGGWLTSLFSPDWDWIQVEVTTHCNALCTYCPRTMFKGSWCDRHLSLETFEKLRPAMARARLVHLQGWGEPFLHPDFFRMVEMAKRAGCRVGTTTNGTLLDQERIRQLIDHDVDVVAFSLAGTGVENDRIRRGTSLRKVMDAITALSRAKEKRGTQKPSIHIAYMLLRSNWTDVARLPQLLDGLGVSDVVISTLDFVLGSALQEEAILPGQSQEPQELQDMLETVSTKAARLGMRVHYHLGLDGRRREVCTENVQRALSINADGGISPCVYTNLALPGISYLVRGENRPYGRLVFGNVNDRPLASIWRSRPYAAFRKSFSRGPLASPCQDCPKLLVS